jgi:hypothetical protein
LHGNPHDDLYCDLIKVISEILATLINLKKK